jgi:hypothetical protein
MAVRKTFGWLGRFVEGAAAGARLSEPISPAHFALKIRIKKGGAAGRMKAEGRRRKKGFLIVLIAIGLACQPAHAGDRKSTGTVQEVARAISVAPTAQVTALPYESRRASVVGLFETENSSGHRSNNERVNEARPTHEHKPLTLFHIKSQLGDIAVQPVMGQVNGAQFSLGF